MGSENDSLQQTYADQLSDFESQLKHTMDDESLLQDVFRAIRELLKDHQESEADIRRILHDRFESGQLREETFQVVQRMLDSIVYDFVATMPGSKNGKDFSETDVIPNDALEAESSVDRLQVGSVLRDRFLLQKEVAGGSMGVVYKALDRRLAEVDEADPWVAIKVLSPKLSRSAAALRAMQQEAAKGRCLTHPNIVRFVDLDREDDLYFIVMEWIEGRSLAAMLDDPGSDPIDLGTSLDIVRQIGQALDYAHRCGVVHADVKPGNVMIMPGGKVKLIDFGVARVRQQQSKSRSNAGRGVLSAATPAYSSMQVLTGEDPVPADDVFSLGCLLYRLVAGYRVFGPRNAAEAAEEGMVPQRPPGLDDRQWRVLKKSLAFSRVARYPSPKAFTDALAGRSDDDGAVTVETDDTSVRRLRPGKSRVWPVFAGLAAIAAGVGYVGTQTNLLDPYLDRVLTAVTRTTAEVAAVLEAADGEPPAAVSATTDTPAAGDASGRVEAPVEAPDANVTESRAADGPAREVPSGSEADAVAGGDRPEPAPLESDAAADETADAPAAVRLEPTHALTIGAAGRAGTELGVVLREDGDAAVIDVNRDANVGVPLALRIEEVGFSGNRSPWESGQYTVGNDGVVEFAAGQASAQITISMMSDQLREADRQVELVMREADVPDRVLASISLTLEDDDQRDFESSLAPNTVGFAVSQVSVGEGDPAVQIDVLRFNPDSRPAAAEYFVRDVTASEGEDYFAPRNKTISFAPGQRTARLLIPLVQDSTVEPDEAFFLEIDDVPAGTDANISRRIAVMIRDDDS